MTSKEKRRSKRRDENREMHDYKAAVKSGGRDYTKMKKRGGCKRGGEYRIYIERYQETQR